MRFTAAIIIFCILGLFAFSKVTYQLQKIQINNIEEFGRDSTKITTVNLLVNGNSMPLLYDPISENKIDCEYVKACGLTIHTELMTGKEYVYVLDNKFYIYDLRRTKEGVKYNTDKNVVGVMNNMELNVLSKNK